MSSHNTLHELGISCAHLVLLNVVLASREGLLLAIDSVLLLPAATIVAGIALIVQVLQAPGSKLI